nr:hypothetical protein [Pectobacterium versatile]
MLHRLPSFDRQHTAMLICIGEIRFGPPYFSLSIDGKELEGRVFGKDMLWSPDSRYLAVQEWLSTAERDGPQTASVSVFMLNRQTCQRVGEKAKFTYSPHRMAGHNLGRG